MVLYLACWIPIAALLTAIVARGGAMPWTEAAIALFPMCLLYAFVCQASWYLCNAVPLREAAPTRLWATHSTAAVLSALAWVGFGWLWTWLLDSTLDFSGINGHYTSQIPIVFGSGALLFLFAVAMNYLLITFELSQQAENKALELQVLAREAELKALRAQVDPHFLYNCLNSINALVMTDPEAARHMCVLLADFLRGSLRLGSEERIPLVEEMKLAECYLDIERVRLGSRLHIEKEVDPECEMCLVPPLIIQPLVENAIIHGVAPMIEGGTVRVHVRRSAAGLKIAVENPFDADSRMKTGSGLGLKNVRMRLANLYNGDGRVDVEQGGTLFRVELQLPCKHK